MPPRAAQAAHDPLRSIGPGQDVDPARRHRAAAAARGLLPGLCADRLFAGVAGAVGADQAGDLSGDAGVRPVDADRRRRQGESLWEFLHHRDDVLRDASRQDADPAADLRPVRGNLHACAKRRLRPPARRAVPRGPRRPGREPRAQGARSENRTGRSCRRALRLHARRLSHPDRAARGLPGASRGPEGRDALDHAEPDAARPHDRRAGARRGAEAGRQARLRGGGRVDRALRRRRLRSCPTPRSSRRCSALSAASSTTRASRRAAPRFPPTCWPARATPSSTSSTSARWPTSRPACATSSRTRCSPSRAFARAWPRSACPRPSPRWARRPIRWPRSSTAGCCASRSGSTCAASS